jgi:ABC-type long-subunit fatty acid transport system fused permease/ATPase subunit
MQTYSANYLELCKYHKKMHMSLISVVLILIAVGVVLWLVNTYIPMDRKIKNILNVVVVIAVVIWLLKVFGLLNKLMAITTT